MKVQYHGAASIIIHTKQNTKILCDPWFDTPAFLGSWVPFPRPIFDFDQPIDYIYISHVHSDHLDLATLSRFNKDTAVLIYDFESAFLYKKLKSLGFTKVFKLKNGEDFRIDDDTVVKIYGPTELHASLAKQDVIDTSLLVKDDENTVLNFNDNIYELRSEVLQKIKEENPKIDLLCHGYTSASSYPQCTVSLSEEEMATEKDRVNQYCLERSERLINYVNPDVFMPFAGFYMLCGKLSHLNHKKANLHPFEALRFYEKNMPNLLKDRKCLVLNNGESYCLRTKTQSKPYQHYTSDELNSFIEEIKDINFPYEEFEIPSRVEDFLCLFDGCYDRMEKHRKQFKFSSDTIVAIKLPQNHYLLLSFDGSGYSITSQFSLLTGFVMMEMDYRLLKRLLEGPRYAHWDNADHGSHINYSKVPNIYEKGIYHLMCYFHI
jgi:UDP-MurNAc hydroxylase